MNSYMSKNGKECWSDVLPTSPFNKELFHEVDMSSKWDDPDSDYDKSYQWAFHSNLGSITVLDRRTGFGWRDTETGYRDEHGKFWLASGNYDVRRSPCKTVGDAIEWVKSKANTCKGA